MIINEKVVVGMKEAPVWVKWRNRIYKITNIGLHHSFYQGQTLYHVFSVVSQTLFLRLKFNTKNLIWILEEVQNAV